MTLCGTSSGAAAISLSMLLVSAIVAGDAPQSVPPIDTGLVERTGTSLLLLDVRATDARGQPIRGLGPKDFKVILNHRTWPVESVDDLCSCVEERAIEPPLTSKSETAPLTPVSPAAGPLPIAPVDPVSYVLHLDFSQLDLDGRVHATEEAERWVRETMQPEDAVMVTAYAAAAGFVVLAQFTGNKELLTAAIRDAYGSTKLRDPFPAAYRFRVEACVRCCDRNFPCNCGACWEQAARDELSHSRGSVRGLKQLLELLQARPGRKALLLFNQRGSLFPAQYYPVNSDRIGDHIALVDEVAAEATLARTVIYTAYTGEAENHLATNFGANLADMTGGRHSKTLSGLSELTSAAGRGCECIYRLGLTPPDREGKVYRAKVEVRGRRLDAAYRVTYLGQAERWMREARAVLSDPESAVHISVASAIVPVAGGKQGWNVKVQIAVDPTGLESLPAGTTTKGNWEVGALLSDAEAKHTWEMLGISELHRSGGIGSRAVEILHERTFEGLAPGHYELRTFVRDRWANVYGGDRSEIELPNAGSEALAGPIVLRAGSSYLPTSLPLRGRDARSATREKVVVTEGTLPLTNRPLAPGEPLEFRSWVCPGKAKATMGSIERYVSSDDQPIFRFEEPAADDTGGCTVLSDRLDTAQMSPGIYTYHVRWRRTTAGEPEDFEASFVIGEPGPRF